MDFQRKAILLSAISAIAGSLYCLPISATEITITGTGTARINALKDAIRTIEDRAKNHDKVAQDIVGRNMPTSNMKVMEEYVNAYNTALRSKAHVGHVTAEQQKQLAEKDQQLQQKTQELQGVEKENKILRDTTGLTPAQLEDFLAKMKEALTNFGDSLFLMKFVGDQESTLVESLNKIENQAAALRTIKEGYEADKAILPLQTYLQLPSKPQDLPLIENRFKQLANELYKSMQLKVKSLETLKNNVKAGMDDLSAVNVSGDFFKKLTDYKTGANSKYSEFFQNVEEILNIFNDFLHLLDTINTLPTPLEFPEKFAQFKNHHAGNLSQLADVTIGAKIIDNDVGRMLNKTGLGLYNFLEYYSDGTDKAKLKDLLGHIDQMRVVAFELTNQISPLNFTKSGENTKAPETVGVTVKTLEETVEQYRTVAAENALLAQIKYFVDWGDKEISYEKVIEFVKGKGAKEDDLLKKLRLILKPWDSVAQQTYRRYVSMDDDALIEIMESGLYENVNKKEKATNKSLYKNFLKKEAQKQFDNIKSNTENFKRALSLLGENKDKSAPGDTTIENIELTHVIGAFLNTSPHATFDQFWDTQKRDPQSVLSMLFDAKSKEKLQDICKEFFELHQGTTDDQRQILSLLKRVIVAHNAHLNFLEKIGKVKAAFDIIKAHLPKYATSQISIETKIKQLEETLSQEPTTYLSLPSDQRAMFYAYNFLMFSHKDLQPLKAGSDIWGTNTEQQIKELYDALESTFKAYVQAREAVKAINPQIKGLMSNALLFGGFKAAHVVSGSPAAHHGAPPPPPSGGLPPPPPFPSPKAAPSLIKSNVLDICNKEAAALETACMAEAMKLDKAIYDDAAMQSIGKLATTEAKKKALILIAQKLGEASQYLDVPLDTQKIVKVIKESCVEVQQIANQQNNDFIIAGENKYRKDPKNIKKLKSTNASSSTASTSSSSGSSGASSPSGVLSPVKTHHTHPKNLTEMQKAETELQKTIDQNKKLEEIKKFLNTQNGAHFTDGFADEELLAFPLHVLVDLQPTDLQVTTEGFEVGKLRDRKFSKEVLEWVHKLRFNSHYKANFDILTAEMVKKEKPRKLLQDNIGVASNIILKFIGDNQLHG